MKKITHITLVVLLLNFLVACQQGQGNKQIAGTVVGGVAGGLLGSQFGKGGGQLAAAGIGAILGAAVGNQVGASLDKYDQQLLNKSSNQALEFAASGHSVEWRNPDSGNHGTITPTRTFKEHGDYCREYQQKVTIGGKESMGYGKACRQPDGQWRIVQ